MIGFQQATWSFNADDLAVVIFVPGLDDPVDALMNPLMMAVLEILGP
jgi:hypothetical protein